MEYEVGDSVKYVETNEKVIEIIKRLRKRRKVSYLKDINSGIITEKIIFYNGKHTYKTNFINNDFFKEEAWGGRVNKEKFGFKGNKLIRCKVLLTEKNEI
jgi:hypothetical protein